MTRLAVTTRDDRIAPSSTPVVDGTYAVGADEGEAGTDDGAVGFYGCNIDGDDSAGAATTATTANQTAEPMAEFEEVLPPGGGRRPRR